MSPLIVYSKLKPCANFGKQGQHLSNQYQTLFILLYYFSFFPKIMNYLLFICTRQFQGGHILVNYAVPDPFGNPFRVLPKGFNIKFDNSLVAKFFFSNLTFSFYQRILEPENAARIQGSYWPIKISQYKWQSYIDILFKIYIIILQSQIYVAPI